MFYALFVCGHYFFYTGLSKFGELVFCLSVFYVSFKFDIILQHNDYSNYI